jgi:hypothetical protein
MRKKKWREVRGARAAAEAKEGGGENSFSAFVFDLVFPPGNPQHMATCFFLFSPV